MTRQPQSFLATLLSTVLATLLLVMSVAFVSLPFSLRAHPGEAVVTASAAPFHPT